MATSPERYCFVISPIGEEGSKTRIHADKVLHHIIEPVMKDFGIAVRRAEQETIGGRMTERMFDRILDADLCIAILTDQNPNVFYELAIRHAAVKPVIIMIKQEQEIPFDIKDLPVIAYDLEVGSVDEGVAKLRGFVRAVEQSGWGANPVFGRFREMGDIGAYRLCAKASDYGYGSPETMLNLVRNAGVRLDIMGITLYSGWRKILSSPVLGERLAAGLQMRVLTLAEDHPALEQLINPQVTSAETVRQHIRDVRSSFEGLSRHANVVMRAVRKGVPHLELAATDRDAVYVQYLFSAGNRDSPLWECKAGSALYRVITAEFEALWRANATA